jgi:hypothetical protein
MISCTGDKAGIVQNLFPAVKLLRIGSFLWCHSLSSGILPENDSGQAGVTKSAGILMMSFRRKEDPLHGWRGGGLDR